MSAEKRPKRTGAKRRADIPAEVIAQLNRGELESANLMEGLVIDFAQLLKAAWPRTPSKVIDEVAEAAELGITRRMALVGDRLWHQFGDQAIAGLQNHPSDTVRGWVCYAIAHKPGLTLAERFEAIRPLANDDHFGVREWAWIAVRPHLADELSTGLKLLESWVKPKQPTYTRRFAVEITRPRGVWTQHLELLKASPELGVRLLEPVQSDTEKYVQDSVANWLNDAAKTQSEWVLELCSRWQEQSATPATERICRRALRSVK